MKPLNLRWDKQEKVLGTHMDLPSIEFAVKNSLTGESANDLQGGWLSAILHRYMAIEDDWYITSGAYRKNPRNGIAFTKYIVNEFISSEDSESEDDPDEDDTGEDIMVQRVLALEGVSAGRIKKRDLTWEQHVWDEGCQKLKEWYTKLKGDERGRIGIITAGKVIRFYRFNKKTGEPESLYDNLTEASIQLHCTTVRYIFLDIVSSYVWTEDDTDVEHPILTIGTLANQR